RRSSSEPFSRTRADPIQLHLSFLRTQRSRECALCFPQTRDWISIWVFWAACVGRLTRSQYSLATIRLPVLIAATCSLQGPSWARPFPAAERSGWCGWITTCRKSTDWPFATSGTLAAFPPHFPFRASVQRATRETRIFYLRTSSPFHQPTPTSSVFRMGGKTSRVHG